MPTILPMMSCAAVACQTARHTSQLHIMPFTSAAPHGECVCAPANARGCGTGQHASAAATHDMRPAQHMAGHIPSAQARSMDACGTGRQAAGHKEAHPILSEVVVWTCPLSLRLIVRASPLFLTLDVQTLLLGGSRERLATYKAKALATLGGHAVPALADACTGPKV